jgi:hypothetical protein
MESSLQPDVMGMAARNAWEAMLLGHQVMPVEELFSVRQV